MNPHTLPIELLVVHHSASSPTTTPVDIRRWHVQENGWDDVGYHWLITSLGILVQARPIIYQGAHARGFNNGTLGVCLIGNNTVENQGWNSAQVETLQRLWLACRTIFGHDLDVVGHRDLAAGTECPGVDVRSLLLGPNARRLAVRGF